VSAQEWLAIGPLLAVFALAMLAVVLDIARPGRDRLVTGVMVVGLLGAIALTGYTA